MVVNDDACLLSKRGALEPIAGKPAPTKVWYHSDLRIFSTIAVVELFSTSPSTFTVPPYAVTMSAPTTWSIP
ncbi:hypothetical protein D9M71_821460 [compost metagenome]